MTFRVTMQVRQISEQMTLHWNLPLTEKASLGMIDSTNVEMFCLAAVGLFVVDRLSERLREGDKYGLFVDSTVG